MQQGNMKQSCLHEHLHFKWWIYNSNTSNEADDFRSVAYLFYIRHDVECAINDIYNRSAWQLYSLIMLRRSGLPFQHMLDYYICKIRQVVEYGCQVWHGKLTLAESTLLKHIHWRALRIIYRDEDSYTALLINADLPKLSKRRKSVIPLSIKFKNHITNSTTCYLLN